MVLWIIFCPLLIFINSFLIGKVYKRINHYLTSYQTTSFGFLTFFGLLTLIFIILFLFNINFSVILFIVLIYQLFLICIYLYNLRYSFITYKINFKYLSLFLILVVISIAMFFITINYKNQPINWFQNTDNHFIEYYDHYFFNQPIDKIQIFQFNKNHYNENLNYIFINIFIYIFQIKHDQIIYFYKYFNFLIFLFSIGLVAINIYHQWFNNHKGDYFVIIIVFFFINLLSYWLHQYYFIIIFSSLLIYFHSAKENEIKSNMLVFLINFVVFTGCFFDINFLLCAVIINIIQIFITFIQKRNNAIDYDISMIFSTLLIIASIFDNVNYLSFILILIIITVYIFFIFYKSSKISKWINAKINQFMYEKIYFFTLFFLILIWVLAIIMMFTLSDIKIEINPWIVKINTNPNSEYNNLITNLFFWIINGLIFIYCLIRNDFWKYKSKNNKNYFQNDLTLLSILTFWNPISINFFNIINKSRLIFVPFNLQTIFFTILMPIIFNKIKIISNKKITKYDYLFNGTIIFITITVCLLNINLGV